ARVLNNQFAGLEREFVPAAEAMPDGKFNFAPRKGEFKGVRTFAVQVRHVAASNFMWAAAILGETPRADSKADNGPEDLKTKAEIIQYLKDSCAYTHKALQSMTAENATSVVDGAWGGKTTRLGMAVQVTGHSFGHDGELGECLSLHER